MGAELQELDVMVRDLGTIWHFMVESREAKDWVEANVSLEPYQWLGTKAFAVEHRYGPALVEGMRDDGLNVVEG